MSEQEEEDRAPEAYLLIQVIVGGGGDSRFPILVRQWQVTLTPEGNHGGVSLKSIREAAPDLLDGTYVLVRQPNAGEVGAGAYVPGWVLTVSRPVIYNWGWEK